jgi:hypothetical protein
MKSSKELFEGRVTQVLRFVRNGHDTMLFSLEDQPFQFTFKSSDFGDLRELGLLLLKEGDSVSFEAITTSSWQAVVTKVERC